LPAQNKFYSKYFHKTQIQVSEKLKQFHAIGQRNGFCSGPIEIPKYAPAKSFFFIVVLLISSLAYYERGEFDERDFNISFLSFASFPGLRFNCSKHFAFHTTFISMNFQSFFFFDDFFLSSVER
jgi:hypothetical protein